MQERSELEGIVWKSILGDGISAEEYRRAKELIAVAQPIDAQCWQCAVFGYETGDHTRVISHTFRLCKECVLGALTIQGECVS